MRLTQMTKDGKTYWLKAETKEDALELEAFRRATMIDDTHARKIGLACVTTGTECDRGGNALPIRLQLEVLP